MIQEIYIIDCENELAMLLREKFENEKGFRFKNIKPCNLETALKNIPDLIIVNEQSIDVNVVELCKKIRENEDNSITPVLVISSNDDEEHKISIMKNNIEYIISKTASNTYLYYAIKNITRLLSVNRTVSPLTGLPGNVQIQTELKKRLLRKETFQVLYFDLDNFKAYNDAYGFSNGDRMIQTLAEIMKKVYGNEGFLGHIGGDDFVIITKNYEVEKYCKKIIELFHDSLKGLYSSSDWQRGYIDSRNRNGIAERFAIASISIAVVTNKEKHYKTMEELNKQIAKVKKKAKKIEGSSIVIV